VGVVGDESGTVDTDLTEGVDVVPDTESKKGYQRKIDTDDLLLILFWEIKKK
jgi:hypothetical protein